MKHYSDLQFLDVGTGEDITIAEFAKIIAEVVGYRGKIIFDPLRPDGAPRKLLDVSATRLKRSNKISTFLPSCFKVRHQPNR